MNRRRFLKVLTRSVAASAVFSASSHARPEAPAPVDASRLPRWRGFNLPDMCVAEYHVPFIESDFEWIAEWGFDFVRLPLSYRIWSDPGDVRKLREDALKEIDRAVELGRKHKVHVNLNLHRAPGYCVNPPKEPMDLWTDATALDACVFHWTHFAKRFKGIPAAQLSFNLLNEPSDIPEDVYMRVVKRLVEAIRAEDSSRLIIADGLKWGREPVHSLASLKIAQSTRGYDPMGVSHYKASWVDGEKWPEPTWPLQDAKGRLWDKARMNKERIEPWKALEKNGVGVHVGEWGSFHHTPHRVALAWMRDCLDLWKNAGWGWALWNFRGAFGILDSGRKDVKYEELHGHKLDRAMLEVLRQG